MKEKDVVCTMEDVSGLVLLEEESETFSGDMLGFKVISEVERLTEMEDTVVVA